MVIFGFKGDIYIKDNCNISEENYSDLGTTYEAPAGKIISALIGLI